MRLRNGDYRAVEPSPDDPSKFIAMASTRQDLVLDLSVRTTLAVFGIVDPTAEQYDGCWQT